MDKLRKIFVVAMICLVVLSAVVYAYVSVNVNLNWTWQTTQSFRVFRESQHTNELQPSSILDLGTFSLIIPTGSQTFYFVNDKDASLTIYPHAMNVTGTNFVCNFNPTSLPLTALQNGTIVMSFTTSGSGSASVTFDLIAPP